MTRKKFVKLLMAQGYQRNTAEGVAMYARLGGWTYEQYLQVTNQNQALYRAVENIKISLVDSFIPVLKAASEAMEQLREAIARVRQSPAAESLLDWERENAPQSNEQHPADMVDALAYVARGGGGHE